MLSFFNKEVVCITNRELDSAVLQEFFSLNGSDEIVCVVDETGKFEGFITYYSLIACFDVQSAVIPHCLELNTEIWTNAREYIKRHKSCAGLSEHMIIPIVDREWRLLCFAYDDAEANREIRMLRELSELNDAYQFSDIFPGYDCVKIHGFNELAFFFAEYLRKHSVNIYISGEMWGLFYQNKEYDCLDFKCLNIWAEGFAGKSENWIEDELRSVSAEFECVDIIYETNIKKGIIHNAMGAVGELLDYLIRVSNSIVIIGTGREALDTYNYLLKYEIDILGFVSDQYEGKKKHTLFGKEVMSYYDVKVKGNDIVWIDPVNRGSAWGIGETDAFDYLGYHRNKQYILIRDYIEIPSEGITNLIQGGSIVCIGDFLLWQNLIGCMRKNPSLEETIFKYYEVSMLETLCQFDKEINDKYILWAAPEELRGQQEWEEKKRNCFSQLEEMGIKHYSDYFCSLHTVMSIQTGTFQNLQSTPKRIIVGATRQCCGCSFLRGLLDNHPNIFLIAEYNSLNMDLFWYCIRLAWKRTDEIMPLFWKIYKGVLYNKHLFNERMNQLLKQCEMVSPQDLFVMFHLANRYMYDKAVTDLSNSIIYWEPHYTDREFLEWAAPKWLQSNEVPCDTLSLVRNSIQRCGSRLKGMLKLKWFGDEIFPDKVYELVLGWVTELSGTGKHIRFEDLKQNPKYILYNLCKEWEIPWSDTLLETTANGLGLAYDNGEQKISNFDLQAVYNDYELYFSELDRMRIMLLALPYQKKYGYPYMELSDFTRSELQELFLKKFRFNEQLEVSSEKETLELRLRVQKMIRKAIQWARMLNCELEMINGKSQPL